MKKLMIVALALAIVVMFSLPTALFATQNGGGELVEYSLLIYNTDGGEVTDPHEGVSFWVEGRAVDIVALADACYVFTGWSGDTDTIDDVGSASTTIIMNDNYTITANFELDVCSPAISITKSASTATANPGDTITYTITVENTGNVKVDIVLLNDPMLKIVNMQIGPMFPKAVWEDDFPYTVKVADIGTLTNTASVTDCSPPINFDNGNLESSSVIIFVPVCHEIYEEDSAIVIVSPVPSSSSTTVEVEGVTEEIEVLEEVATVRTKPLTVWHVGCNDDGHLELIFIYPYKDNNWLTIYDMAGNEVHREDISYSNPRTTVALPDSMYIVKTFHSEGHIIQEFTVGLPCGVAVEGVAELPRTGFDYTAYTVAAAILAGLAGILVAFRKRNFKATTK